MDRLIKMVLRRVLGHAMRRGVNAGLGRAARGRDGSAELSAEQEAQLRGSKKRTRKAMRIARRFGRF